MRRRHSLPKSISDHAIVRIGGDIVVIGGYDGVDYQSALYKLTCSDGNCQWHTLPDTLRFARANMIAIAIPDDFFDCRKLESK